jgi:DNA-binding protein HU-beta
MTKADIINSVAAKAGLTKKDAEIVLGAVLDTIKDGLANGEKVQIVGFGTFEVRTRAAREGVNPQTHERIKIPETKVPAFKAGSTLKEAITK